MTAWNRQDSPQMRRLRSDAALMEQLRSESSILTFKCTGTPAQRYLVEFQGKSLTREGGKVAIRSRHQVEIKLGASYPRSIPDIRWLTPIYHPNISEIGMVCLGGYGTHWVPSLRLDALCTMLWDMARYYNYDVRSPYNRDAALWVAQQTAFTFPIDARALRDIRVNQGRIETVVVESRGEATPPQEFEIALDEAAASEAAGEAPMVLVLDDAVPLSRLAMPRAAAAPAPQEDVIFLD